MCAHFPAQSFENEYSGANAAEAEEELEIQMTPTLESLMRWGDAAQQEADHGDREGDAGEEDGETAAFINDIENGSEEVELDLEEEAIKLNLEPDDHTVATYATKEKSFSKSNGGGRKKCLGMLAFLLVVGGGTMAALVLIVFAPGDKSSIDASKNVATEDPGKEEAVDAEMEGEAAEVPAASPLDPPVNTADPSEVAMYALQKSLPANSFTLISKEGTAQSAAFDHVMNEDAFVYDWDGIHADDAAATRALVQRYVLNALYYALKGEDCDDSTNWNTNLDVCTWYGVKPAV